MHAVLLIIVTGSESPQIVSVAQQSVQISGAVNVPFLHHQVLECDSSGREYTNVEHDITVRIPEGAVAEGTKLHIKLGVAMCGPFNFPGNTQPISPILWLCPLEADYELKKPYQVVLPHYLMDKAHNYSIQFTKANHNDTESDSMSYTFLALEVDVKLASIESQGYGIAEIDHFCYLCLTVKNKPAITTDIGYCLTTVECTSQSQQSVFFCVSYFLPTCLQVRDNYMLCFMS